VYTWSDGRRYEGGFENSLRHGKGVYTWSNGASCEGGWVSIDGKKNGKGVTNVGSYGYGYGGGSEWRLV
jgi:hypothetical protein